ncbi:MAG: DUF1549 domain-containing protein, partial [Acidobacteria bacterium]|nr:DUF1549 domain-containing protein [Acidobacteriota bacterium]
MRYRGATMISRLGKLAVLLILPAAVISGSLSEVESQSGSQEHWAFIAPQRPAQPEVHRKDWVKTPVDRFVLAGLEARGAAPSPEAERETLIRRVSLDLTGLPPTLTEIDQFLADSAPDAYERLVERLLLSPHYGERWARWWLDAARYA